MLEPWDPNAPIGDEVAADTLARRACLDYGPWRPHHLAEARALLAADPALARANIHVSSTSARARRRRIRAREHAARRAEHNQQVHVVAYLDSL